MPFSQTPLGALSDFSLVGTDGIDITTVTGATPNVTVDGLGGNDQLTVQNTNGVVNGLQVLMGDGDDRVFADSAPNINEGSVVLTNSFVRGGNGDDILFGTQAGIADTLRTAYLNFSTVNGNAGNDLIRVFGALSSRIEGGADQDTIELANLSATSPSGIIDASNGVTSSPDRYDGSTIQGGLGDDVIRLTLGNTNVVGTRINGNQDVDTISNFGVALTGNWQGSTIFGGQGGDLIDLGTNVTSSLLVLGQVGDDTILTGTGNDTVIGGNGSDNIVIAGGDNLVYGDNAPFDGSTVPANDGSDSIFIDSGIGRAGSNTVFAGGGIDNVLIDTDGNNIVQLGGGNDIALITGDGNNSVTGDAGNDTITITGNGINTIQGGGGNDFITFTGTALITAVGFGGDDNDTIVLNNGLNATLDGEGGNDTILINASGNVQVGGGSGNDVIDFTLAALPNRGAVTSSSASVNGGTGADTVIENAITTRFVQQNGDSVAASSVTDTADAGGVFSTWSNGDVINWAATPNGFGVDLITGFDLANDLFETTLGDLGLDQTTGVGLVYDAFGLEIQGGMVATRTYYLTGAWNAAARTFTVDESVLSTDTLLITAGNNGPMTGNDNAVVLAGFVNFDFPSNTSLLTDANFDTFLG